MLTLVAVALVLELALFVLARLGPALASLLRIGAAIVAVAFAIAIWHASHTRSGTDRRHADRRKQG